MILWDANPPSSQFSGLQNKVALPCPNNLSLDLLACCAVNSASLQLVTQLEGNYNDTGKR